MKKLSFLWLAVLSLMIISCSQMSTADRYYHQQQQNNNNNADDKIPTLPPVVEEDPEDPEDPDNPDANIPGSAIITTMFDVLQPDGVINAELLAKFPQAVQDLYNARGNEIGQLPVFPTGYGTTTFKNKFMRAEFQNNVPRMHYLDGTWTETAANTYQEKPAPNTQAGEASIYKIEEVAYFMYDGINPFYAVDGKYNTATYGDKTDTIMNRFMFYRFEGSALSGPRLNNMLVAVDTYTGLVFSFGKPTDFEHIAIAKEDVPIFWEAVDVKTIAADGKKYKFYEYDPAGYVDATGKFVTYAWYETLSQGNATNQHFFDPPKTGKSPYSHPRVIETVGDVVEIAPFTPVITATTDVALVDESGKYYTGITFPVKEFDVKYELFVRERGTEPWGDAVETVTVLANAVGTYRHYDAIILTALPQYMARAKHNITEAVLGESAAVTGSRGLTNKEIFFAAMNSIRHGLIDNKVHERNGSSTANFEYSIDEGKFIHKRTRDGRTSQYTHKYTVANYKPYFVELTDGSFTYKSSRNWSTDVAPHNIQTTENIGAVGSAYTGIVNFTSTYGDGSIEFNGIHIDENAWNNPPWTGTFTSTINNSPASYSSEDVPFGFYMNAETFRNAIVGKTEDPDSGESGENPSLFTPVITASNHTSMDGGRYYTDIAFTDTKDFDVIYELFIRVPYIKEGDAGAWSLVETVDVPANTTPSPYRHYDALILSALPQYKVIAKPSIDDTLTLGESAAVEGSRGLTEREILLAAIETIRTTFDWFDASTDEYYFVTTNLLGSLKKRSRAGSITGNYYHGLDRSGMLDTNCRRYMRFVNYKNSLVTLDGTFMKDDGDAVAGQALHGVWVHEGFMDDSKWPKDTSLNPRKEKLTVTFGDAAIDIVLNNIDINNDDANNPAWIAGSFDVTQNGATTPYDNTSGVPFGFFMDAATFRTAIGGTGYTQK